MTTEYLTMAEIEKRYPNEWVLIDRPKTGRNRTEILGGFVAVHNTDRKQFDQQVQEQSSVRDCALLYVGKNDIEDLYLL